MNCIEEILAKYPMVVLDGAFATELEARGFDINDALWSAKALHERPDLVKEVHLDYLRAGADVVESASYQATVEGFLRIGLTKERAEELIRLSVKLAREARDEFLEEMGEGRPRPLVAASVGPYGAFLADGSEYRGEYGLEEDALVRFHADRMQMLAEAGADLLAVETLPCLVEAKAVVHAVREKRIAVPLWVSFSCKDEKHISDGTEISACAAWLNQAQEVAAVGLNCTAPQYVVSLIQEIKAHTDKPVVVYPNSGETYDPASKTWQGAAVGFAERAEEWYRAGARLIGGCCRTKPRDIWEIACMRERAARNS
ncbi:MAG: homocysteine S-methyltransferase [Selenomonadaceae bacterium]|nr:homocysteine S-methyltransferase [Selenomonadaceae bacterium]MBQ1915446.1 homocysteine S-methyltransferase [Selenomonadaceae bacterium]